MTMRQESGRDRATPAQLAQLHDAAAAVGMGESDALMFGSLEPRIRAVPKFEVLRSQEAERLISALLILRITEVLA